MTRRSLEISPECPIEPHYLSLPQRCKARTFENLLPSSLSFKNNICYSQMIVVWQLYRSLPTKLLQLQHEVIPGWNEVNTKLSPKIIATKIGYGPMIPSAPTDPSVVHKGIEYAVKLSAKLGLKHTIVTADQAIYDIAFSQISLREKAPDHDETYGHLILMLGQFHLASNFNAAIGKLMRGSGGEEILAKSGICKLGTANKIFGPSGDYYQSMRAHRLLLGDRARLHLDAFED